MSEQRPPRDRIADAFGRAAQTYDSSATVQREMCGRLAAIAKAYPVPAGPGAILDAGCGTGYALAELAAIHAEHMLLALDLAAPMLARCVPLEHGQRCLQADIHSLPFSDGSLAGVWSSLSLQWCDPQRALAEIGRCLRPGGIAWIATLGPRTFRELRLAFEGIDQARHVLQCHSLETWRSAGIAAGLEPRCEQQHELRATATDLRTLLRDVKAIGAHAIGPERRRALLGKNAWATVVDRFEAFRDADGRVGVTYDGLMLIFEKIS